LSLNLVRARIVNKSIREPRLKSLDADNSYPPSAARLQTNLSIAKTVIRPWFIYVPGLSKAEITGCRQ
jgi:hypothetical protein